MNWLAAVLLFPEASVNVFAATSIVVAPILFGINVAVYMVLLTAEKLLMVPPETVMSPDAKSVVASFMVKVNVKVPSLVLELSATALLPLLAVITRVGAVSWITKFLLAPNDPEEPGGGKC